MAEDEVALEQGADGVDAPPNEEEQKPDPIADLASEMGWVPQDQFRGDPTEWKPAADFIKAGRDINRGLSRELRSTREEVQRIARTTSQLMEEKVAETEAAWQARLAKAVETGDGDLAKRATDEIVKIKTAARPNADTGEPPETAEFKARNADWFQKDDLATLRALEIAERLRQMGKSVPEQLQGVERAIKKEFPELFKAAPKPPPGVQTSESRNPVTTSRAKGFNDMPAESQKMALEYEKRHGIKRDQFAQSYWADQAKRKVG